MIEKNDKCSIFELFNEKISIYDSKIDSRYPKKNIDIISELIINQNSQINTSNFNTYLNKELSSRTIFQLSYFCLLWLIISVVFKIPYQKNIPQKILGFLWIIVGFKYFLEDGNFGLIVNQIDDSYDFWINFKNFFLLLSGVFCIFVGLIFLINLVELNKRIKQITLKSFFSGILKILSIIFIDNNYNLFNFEKKIFHFEEPIKNPNPPYNLYRNGFNTFEDLQNNLYSMDYQDEYDYFDSFFTSDNLFKLFIICINFIPIFLNSIWGDLVTFESKNNFLLKNLIPNPLFISLITMLLKYFLVPDFRSEKIFCLYNIINFTCYLIFISFIVYEFYFSENFSFWTIFYLILIILNFMAILYAHLEVKHIINFTDPAKEISNSSNIDGVKSVVEYSIKFNPLGNSGIKGFLEREFFMDNYGTIANAFYLISNQRWEFIPDTSVKRVKVEPQLIQYIYPIKK